MLRSLQSSVYRALQGMFYTLGYSCRQVYDA